MPSLLHLYPVQSFLLNGLENDFQILHFTSLNLDEKLIAQMRNGSSEVHCEEFTEEYYAKDLIERQMWLKKKKGAEEVLSLKIVSDHSGYLSCKEILQSNGQDEQQYKRIAKRVPNLPSLLMEAPYITFAVHRWIWKIGNGVDFYIDASRQFGEKAEDEFYVVCGCK